MAPTKAELQAKVVELEATIRELQAKTTKEKQDPICTLAKKLYYHDHKNDDAVLAHESVTMKPVDKKMGARVITVNVPANWHAVKAVTDAMFADETPDIREKYMKEAADIGVQPRKPRTKKQG